MQRKRPAWSCADGHRRSIRRRIAVLRPEKRSTWSIRRAASSPTSPGRASSGARLSSATASRPCSTASRPRSRAARMPARADRHAPPDRQGRVDMAQRGLAAAQRIFHLGAARPTRRQSLQSLASRCVPPRGHVATGAGQLGLIPPGVNAPDRAPAQRHDTEDRRQEPTEPPLRPQGSRVVLHIHRGSPTTGGVGLGSRRTQKIPQPRPSSQDWGSYRMSNAGGRLSYRNPKSEIENPKCERDYSSLMVHRTAPAQ